MHLSIALYGSAKFWVTVLMAHLFLASLMSATNVQIRSKKMTQIGKDENKNEQNKRNGKK